MKKLKKKVSTFLNENPETKLTSPLYNHYMSRLKPNF